MEMSAEDLRVSKTCGIPVEKFKETRTIEQAEKAAAEAGERPDPDGLTAVDLQLIRRFGLDRAKFLESRRAETRG
jgi:hypothetical protein